MVEYIAIVPPYEALLEEVIESQDAAEELAKAVRERDLPDCYFEHPVVAASSPEEPPPYPGSMYLDATPFTKKESIFAILFINLITGTRHLTCCVRKNCMCRCGCMCRLASSTSKALRAFSRPDARRHM